MITSGRAFRASKQDKKSVCTYSTDNLKLSKTVIIIGQTTLTNKFNTADVFVPYTLNAVIYSAIIFSTLNVNALVVKHLAIIRVTHLGSGFVKKFNMLVEVFL